MRRRVVSLLLMPMILLAQGVKVGHGHLDQPPGHGAIPHFHVGNGPVRQAEHHHHHGNGHHHHHHGSNPHHHHDQEAPESTQEGSGEMPAPLPDHDDDAVYFPLGLETAALLSQQPRVVPANSLAEVLWSSFSQLVSWPAGSPLPRNHSPPGWPASSCPIYLQMLTLLI